LVRGPRGSPTITAAWEDEAPVDLKVGKDEKLSRLQTGSWRRAGSKDVTRPMNHDGGIILLVLTIASTTELHDLGTIGSGRESRHLGRQAGVGDWQTGIVLVWQD